MSTMVMALRVVVPPHPLIGHWLGVLRDRHTPAALYATATTELGRWLTYEALRDWLPHRRVAVDTALASVQADLVDATVPLVALPLLTAGLGLWHGAQSVLPSARVVHLWEQQGDIGGLDAPIDPRAGVLLFCAELSDGERLIRVLDHLAEQGVAGDRLRVVTALASAPGLQALGERHGALTLYTAAIDPDLNPLGQTVPGIGVVGERLFAGTVLESAAAPA
jgi:uracil phosphoribosyltransferase